MALHDVSIEPIDDGRWYWEVRLDDEPLGMAMGGWDVSESAARARADEVLAGERRARRILGDG